MARNRSRVLRLYGGGRGVPIDPRYPAYTIAGGIAEREWMVDDPILAPAYKAGKVSLPPKAADKSYSYVKPTRIIAKDFRHGVSRYRFKGIPLPPFMGHGGHAFFLPWTELKTKFLASIRPSQPVVDEALFLWELRELPSLLKGTGDILAGRARNPVSESILAANFGWIPLINDVRSMLNFAKEMNAHIERLLKAVREKRIEGSLGTYDHSWQTLQGSRWASGYGKATYHLQHTANTSTWGVAKINSINLPPYVSESAIERINRALGHTWEQRPITFWNAVPFSWLIDYFFSVGEWIEATIANISCDIDHFCLMQRCEVETRFIEEGQAYLVPDDDNPEFAGRTIVPGYAKNVYWTRRVFYDPKPGIDFFPFLSGKQLANLVALATSSRARYAR